MCLEMAAVVAIPRMRHHQSRACFMQLVACQQGTLASCITACMIQVMHKARVGPIELLDKFDLQLALSCTVCN